MSDNRSSYKVALWWLLPLLLCILAIRFYGGETPVKKRVCIIGAGPSGLTSAKQFSRLNDFEVVVFEKNPDIGGQWLYTENAAADYHGFPAHSGIYKYMRANYPKPLLAFPDYLEFHGENRSFVTHATVLEYLKNYTDVFDIRRFIQFDTLVEEVDYKSNTNNWKIKIKNLNTDARDEISCEAVMVCSGIFFKPYIPEIPGIENFSGRVIHSHEYRRPEEFSNQTVAILGASISGLDLSVDLYEFAKTIYLSHRHEKHEGQLPENLEQVPGIVEANNDELILSNGSRINVDALIISTGYLYDYPFLSSSTGIVVDSGRYVYPLYKHFINIEHPTMAFIALPNRAISWQHAYVQAHYFAALLQGKVMLPSRLEMLEDSKLPAGVPKKAAHYLMDKSIPYYNELAQISGAVPLIHYYERALSIFIKDLIDSPLYFKEKNMYVHDDASIELRCIHQTDICQNKMYPFPETEDLALLVESFSG